ncbi:MAG: succinyl-diaminopimelate desuccinylase [Actinomycetota bacterium]
MSADLAARLSELTLELVDLPSESRNEAAILDHMARRVPGGAFRLIDDADAVRCFLPGERRASAPLVLLVGHVDTVPANGNLPGRREGDVVVGRGAADMKGALAVILEVAQVVADGRPSDIDVGLLFFGREELPAPESALAPFLERCSEVRSADLAIVMEPTDGRLELGCLGNLNATVTVRGRAAHAARPWLGENAVHAALEALRPIAERGPRDVTIDGLTFREVVSVTRIAGGIASNVVPDVVVATVNLRYAPGRTPAEAEAELRDLVGSQVEVAVVGNAAPAPAATRNALVERLRRAGGLEAAPKQAWTPVAELAAAGVDAVNFGPGDPGYAHRDDERIEAASLVHATEVLLAFLAGGEGG